MALRIKDKKSEDVIGAMAYLRDVYGDRFSQVLKTITIDNGREFTSLHSLEHVCDTLIYYAHPYSSFEKDNVENHNGLLRRHIKKKTRIDSYTDMKLETAIMWMNNFPRRILNYRTPDELFEDELDIIYTL